MFGVPRYPKSYGSDLRLLGHGNGKWSLIWSNMFRVTTKNMIKFAHLFSSYNPGTTYVAGDKSQMVLPSFFGPLPISLIWKGLPPNSSTRYRPQGHQSRRKTCAKYLLIWVLFSLHEKPWRSLFSINMIWSMTTMTSPVQIENLCITTNKLNLGTSLKLSWIQSLFCDFLVLTGMIRPTHQHKNP